MWKGIAAVTRNNFPMLIEENWALRSLCTASSDLSSFYLLRKASERISCTKKRVKKFDGGVPARAPFLHKRVRVCVWMRASKPEYPIWNQLGQEQIWNTILYVRVNMCIDTLIALFINFLFQWTKCQCSNYKKREAWVMWVCVAPHEPVCIFHPSLSIICHFVLMCPRMLVRLQHFGQITYWKKKIVAHASSELSVCVLQRRSRSMFDSRQNRKKIKVVEGAMRKRRALHGNY